MELLGGLIAAGLLAAAPAVPGLRSVTKAVVKSGMAVAEASAAVAVAVTHQVGDLVTHVRSADTGEAIDSDEAMTDAASVQSMPAAPVAEVSQSMEPSAAPADLSGDTALSASTASLRPVAKAAVKSGMALANTAKGAAGVAAGAIAVTAQQLSGLAAQISPEKKTGDEALADGELPPEVTDGAAGQPAGVMTSDENTTDQIEPEAVDDLVQINGIGPKIATMLQEAGITSLAKLAATDVERLREILDQGGARYRVTDPTSWPAQAQALLDTPTTDEVKPLDLNDLEQISGIGPKIASLLHAAGITNLMELAATSVERLQEILNGAGARYRVTDPSSWPSQAQTLLDTIQ